MTPTRYFRGGSSPGRSSTPPCFPENRNQGHSCTEALKCLYTNIDGLNAVKGAELQIQIDNEKPHAIFITETKLTDEITTSQFLNCYNYTVLRKDRTTEKGGGGGVGLCCW